MSAILLPPGVFLITICVTYITMVTVFEIEYHPVRDGVMATIGVLGCILMLIGLFTLHIP